MDNNILDYTHIQTEDAAASKTFLSKVFSWMLAALLISGTLAWYFGHSLSLMETLHYPTGGATPLGYAVMFAPLAFVLIMSLGFQKLPYIVLMLLYVAYAAVTGISLSFIFLIYNIGAIYKAFFFAAGTFGLMATLGYTTKVDLTRFGTLMYIGLGGIILSSIINYFVGSSTMDYLISIGGVVIFTGLTAYDVQKLKQIGSGTSEQYGSEAMPKLVILGALTLYLDFLNLFLFLLRLAGGDRK
jgi:FtsH-binding integral membrane protein